MDSSSSDDSSGSDESGSEESDDVSFLFIKAGVFLLIMRDHVYPVKGI